MAESIVKRLRGYLNRAIKGPFTSAVLEALAAGDALNEANILAVKEQLFIMTASGEYLDRLLAGIGIVRPPGVGISDDLLRELAIAQTNSKLVRNILLEVLEIFYGSDAVRANTLSGSPQGYVLKDGMTLIFQVDTNPTPLVVTFQAKDFNNIANASAEEVANVISTVAFNSGYSLTASTQLDTDTGETYVQLMSGTRGPRSAITVTGGSAQNILNFSKRSLSIPQNTTQFTTSFVGQYIRFTWSGGLNPVLGLVRLGDYVNIYGNQFLIQNQGSYIVEDVQDGPIGQAYFDIINPNFLPQGVITLGPVGGASGNGVVIATANIVNAPSGAIRSSNIVTIQTTTPHGFLAGQTVTISGVDNTPFNGTFTIASTPTATTFTYPQLGLNVSSGGGSASVDYVIQPLAGAVRSSGVTTITTVGNHNLIAGQLIAVERVNDSSFDGTFNIIAVGANTLTYAQNASNDLVFFTPIKSIIQELPRYASIYEVNPYEVVVFMPATTAIVKRTLIGSWHVHNSNTDTSFVGSYTYDVTTGFPISAVSTKLTTDIFEGQLLTVGFGSNTLEFPDDSGFLVFDYGTANQEGPVRYLGRPSSGSLLLDPSYKFKKSHVTGSDVTLLINRTPYVPTTDGTDYPTYVTGTVTGRIASEDLLQKLVASGILLTIIIVYPQSKGLNDLVHTVYNGDPV